MTGNVQLTVLNSSSLKLQPTSPRLPKQLGSVTEVYSIDSRGGGEEEDYGNTGEVEQRQEQESKFLDPSLSNTVSIPKYQNMDPTISQPSRLLNLPAEIRLLIWDSLFTIPCDPELRPDSRSPQSQRIAIGHSPQRARSRSVLSALLVCRQIRDESRVLFYKLNLLSLHSPSSLFRFLASRTPMQRHAITRIHVDNAGPHWTSSMCSRAFCMLQLLPNLRHFYLDFEQGLFVIATGEGNLANLIVSDEYTGWIPEMYANALNAGFNALKHLRGMETISFRMAPRYDSGNTFKYRGIIRQKEPMGRHLEHKRDDDRVEIKLDPYMDQTRMPRPKGLSTRWERAIKDYEQQQQRRRRQAAAAPQWQQVRDLIRGQAPQPMTGNTEQIASVRPAKRQKVAHPKQQQAQDDAIPHVTRAAVDRRSSETTMAEPYSDDSVISAISDGSGNGNDHKIDANDFSRLHTPRRVRLAQEIASKMAHLEEYGFVATDLKPTAVDMLDMGDLNIEGDDDGEEEYDEEEEEEAEDDEEEAEDGFDEDEDEEEDGHEEDNEDP